MWRQVRWDRQVRYNRTELSWMLGGRGCVYGTPPAAFHLSYHYKQHHDTQHTHWHTQEQQHSNRGMVRVVESKRHRKADSVCVRLCGMKCACRRPMLFSVLHVPVGQNSLVGTYSRPVSYVDEQPLCA